MNGEMSTVVDAVGALTTIAAVFSNVVGFVKGIVAFFIGLGVTQAQALAVLGVGALVSFIFILEFMQQISKLLVLLLLLWVVGSIAGLI